ncbi:MAG TPA: CheR family methyltransferase [Vicinamibacteria bacterium]|nr:CheR family methyltransferase [Vicinamibacteria bacterium]
MTADVAGPGEKADGKLEHLVVVGSSAGGIEALGTLLGGLKPSFPAPVILAQHLDPNHQSHLQTVLQRKTELPVVLVTEREKMQPGSVYVVPANRHVVVDDGTVGVEGVGDLDRPRPSVDLLLKTAARAYGERLVAVILTGAGSDGAAGAVDVKQAGGTIVIQNPRTARYPSMPLALPPTVVDHVVDIERMAALLKELLVHPAVPKARESVDAALAKVIGIVSQQSDIDFHSYKSSTLLRRIGRRMTAVRAATLDEYALHLEAQPDEVGQLASDLLINVTEFFRDRDAFLFLRNTVLPELVERGRKRERRLRFWSAGCSTGEEAYSLVIGLAEILGAELAQWNIRVFATDVDEEAVAYARRGLYPENVLGALSDGHKEQFFEKADPGLRIRKTLRQMVIFGTQDIGHGVPFPRIDLVLCRNLLIYFKPEKQNQVLDIFAYSLAPTQGYLFLGKAETVRPSKATFEEVNKRYKVYRCVAAPTPGQVAAHAKPGGGRSLAAPSGASAPPADEPMAIAELRKFNELVLRAMPVGLVVIDRNYHMVTSNPTARRLLQLREHPGDDFLHAARGLPYNEIRSSIDAAFRERVPTTLPEVNLAAAGEDRYIQVTICRVHPDDTASDYAVVSLVDVTDTVRGARRLRVSQDEQRLLVDELSATNKRLGEMNKDLQDSNEELQAANEELLLAHEEMQATNEEFEATNEELQATNEELETNNEEMQATNEELETTNEELSARSTELHDITHTLGSERTRLSRMVELAPFCMMILKGPGLVIDSFNPAATRVLATEETRGRTFEEVFAADAVLIDGVRGAYRTGTTWTSPRRRIQVRQGEGVGEQREFRFIAVPTELDGSTDGVVLYAEDLSALPPD